MDDFQKRFVSAIAAGRRSDGTGDPGLASGQDGGSDRGARCEASGSQNGAPVGAHILEADHRDRDPAAHWPKKPGIARVRQLAGRARRTSVAAVNRTAPYGIVLAAIFAVTGIAAGVLPTTGQPVITFLVFNPR